MKATKMKKTFCFNNCACYFLWKIFVLILYQSFLSYLSRKKGTTETFLSLGLIISWSRPMASTSKMRPWLQKTFPRFPFFYFDNLDKSQIRRRQIFPQSSQHNFQNKILFLNCVCVVLLFVELWPQSAHDWQVALLGVPFLFDQHVRPQVTSVLFSNTKTHFFVYCWLIHLSQTRL